MMKKIGWFNANACEGGDGKTCLLKPFWAYD